MDQVTPAFVDQRAVVATAYPELIWTSASFSQVISLKTGIMVARNTSRYIQRNVVEPSLGTDMQVLERFILLTVSQITLKYISRHPHPSPSHELQSP
jgi:hypothetical protein